MKAFITGVSGQDGSYLAELLLKKGYEVHGLIRRSSFHNTGRIDHIIDKLHLHTGDMTDFGSLVSLLQNTHPNEIYNLAAQSFVRTSFENPVYTANTDALGALRLMEAARIIGIPKFYQASTSEMFGSVSAPQNEETPFRPCSSYGIAKLFAHWTAINYRERGMFACGGILFNHESPRRGEEFVTKKIVRELVRIRNGQQDKLILGNLDARRDWGYAPDYVEAMWKMMQQDKPDDYVIATGQAHTVREFLDETAMHLNMDWKKVVEINPFYFRPTEVDYLLGDASKAKRVLGWEPKVKFHELVKLMVDAELEKS